MSAAGDQTVQAALLSERLLAAHTRPLAEHEMTDRAKMLLTRPTSPALSAEERVALRPIVTDADWLAYERARILVEAGFGADADEARAMVAALRARCSRLALNLSWATLPRSDAVVGAVGWYRLPDPFGSWARLQEVDVFPSWRGRGYGDALLAATLDVVAGEGVTVAVVGADEDDWPLSWYRRRGFRDAVRVPPIS